MSILTLTFDPFKIEWNVPSLFWSEIFPKQEVQRATYRAPEYNVPPFLTDRPGRQYLFTHRPEKHKLGRRRWDLASCQVSLNSVQRFQRRSRKCLSQSEARAANLFFRSARKHKLGRGRWDLASCQVSLNSIQRFQRRSWKCEKLTTDGRRTDGRRTMRDHNSALEPSVQVH